MDGRRGCASPPSDDAWRWQAVQARDTRADGLFVYTVQTTRVYCRPTCKARLARRANVRFFASGRDAQAAGFRACKRCRPELAGLMPEERAVRRVRALVRDGPAPASLRDMAARAGLSKWHFHRVFKRCVGVTPAEYRATRHAARGDGPPARRPGEAGRADAVALPPGPGAAVLAAADGDARSGPGAPSGAEDPSAGTGPRTWTPLTLDDVLDWPDDDA